jgi:hypothetical protein
VKEGFEIEVRDTAFTLGDRQSAELFCCCCVTALSLDVAALLLVLRIPTAVKVGHVSIATVKLLIITM